MKTLALSALLLITACASPVPTVQQYLLRADHPSQYAIQSADSVVGLSRVTVASYIDGLGLVLETAGGEVHTARSHQWAEPLRESLRSFLASEISTQAGRVIRTQRSGENHWKQRIDIRIDELHGTTDGQARLVAYWSVTDSKQRTIISENGFVDTESLSGDGYESLVLAHKKLLRKLAAAIAKTL